MTTPRPEPHRGSHRRDRRERIAVPAAVAIGGAIGSLARYAMTYVVGDWTPSSTATFALPVSTFATNLIGSYLLGVVLVVGEVVGRRAHVDATQTLGSHHRPPAWVQLWRPFMATGVLGGFTTFSTMVLEATAVPMLIGVLYLVSSVVLGVMAYTLGNAQARQRFGVRA